MDERFWERKALSEMYSEEWEAVCDGCGKCCLLTLEDENDGTVYYTDVHCQLFDCTACRCKDYGNRHERVPSCLRLTPESLHELYWLPLSCAYRRLAEGRGLPPWHHLLSGSRATIHEAHRSVRGRAVPEHAVTSEELEERLVDWPLRDA